MRLVPILVGIALLLAVVLSPPLQREESESQAGFDQLRAEIKRLQKANDVLGISLDELHRWVEEQNEMLKWRLYLTRDRGPNRFLPRPRPEPDPPPYLKGEFEMALHALTDESEAWRKK